MAELRWSPSALRAARQLPAPALHDLDRILDLVMSLPEMFRVVEAGRYQGCRLALIDRRWSLYYRVREPDHTVEIVAIRAARRRPV